VLAKPLNFENLSLNDSNQDDFVGNGPKDSDARLMEMLAAQAAHRNEVALEDEDAIINNDKMTESEKKDILQRALTMAASNGDTEKIKKLLEGDAKPFVDVNLTDDDGTPALIYASCFVRRAPMLGGEDIILVYMLTDLLRATRRLSRL
jgi:hypothetical protein